MKKLLIFSVLLILTFTLSFVNVQADGNRAIASKFRSAEKGIQHLHK
jgi:hypothetical protein